jgi:hypothetical protein
VSLLVAQLAEELAVGELLASAGANRLLVVEFGAPGLAGTVVLARVARAFAGSHGAQASFLFNGLWKHQ